MAHNQALRYHDDLLERLVQLNLNEIAELPEDLARELAVLGVDRPYRYTIPALIEQVWTLQQAHLTPVVIVRQPSQRRRRKEEASDVA